MDLLWSSIKRYKDILLNQLLNVYNDTENQGTVSTILYKVIPK